MKEKVESLVKARRVGEEGAFSYREQSARRGAMPDM